ncbi:MAG: serine/threonine-protein phosphatase [Erysipelotrichaceae bacterium]|nr:serine/threonine-protein phosphatase [Erysipelotrichaceae bacterium]
MELNIKKPSGKRWFLAIGLLILTVTAFSCFVFGIKLFSKPGITPNVMYNAGIDVMGSFVCAMLFFGCTGGRKGEIDDSNSYFIMLIVLTCYSFFVNEWECYVQGMVQYRTWCLVMNGVTKIIDFALVYCFYRYVRTVLGFKGKVAAVFDRLTAILLIPAVLLIIVNMFVPICFSVDADGVFQKEKLYWLVDLYLVCVAPPTTFLVLKSDVSRRQKIVSISFIFIPIVHYLFTKGAHGYATQYGSVLVAIVLIYSVLFSERSINLASTKTELYTATKIQMAMLPHVFPPFPDRKEFSLFASMDPAKEVGGDFYDFFLIDDDHLCVVIADVSGKSVPAALFMMASSIIIRGVAGTGVSPEEILTISNRKICSHNPYDMFVTVWLGILEISNGKLTASNAGHEYPAIMKAGGNFELLKDRHGLVIGVMDDTEYTGYTVQLEPGDKLFVYTDGVSEATDKNNTLFGTDRMLEALNKDPGADPETILKNVNDGINGFVRKAEQFDDVTMLCLEYKGKQ